MIKTVNLSSGVNKTDFDPDGNDPYFFTTNEYVWIKNLSADTVYVSLSEDCGKGADGTASIASGGSGMIVLDSRNAFYAVGSGDVEIHTSDVSTCPFKLPQNGGDSTGGSTAQLVKSGTIPRDENNGAVNIGMGDVTGHYIIDLECVGIPEKGLYIATLMAGANAWFKMITGDITYSKIEMPYPDAFTIYANDSSDLTYKIYKLPY